MSSNKLLGHLVNNMLRGKSRKTPRSPEEDSTILGGLKRKLVDSSDVLRSISDTFTAYDGYKDSLEREASGDPDGLFAGQRSTAVRGIDFEAGSQVDTAATTVKLIQAAIAAGHADGTLDERERASILKLLKKAGVNEEEEFFILGEMEHPRDVYDLAKGIESHEDKLNMFGIAAATISVDTPEEVQFLEDFAEALGLDPEEVARINEYLETRK